jgi:photosystem II stability/assembly factor-like uncharacterized protein
VVAFVVLAGVAAAGEDYFVAGVDKPVSVESLRGAGLLYLADVGDEYIVMGDEPALMRLEASGARSRNLLMIQPGDNVYLLTARDFASEMLYSRVLTEVGEGRYLAVVETDEIESLRLVPFEKERLLPRDFPRAAEFKVFGAPIAVTPKPAIQAMVASVSQDTLTQRLSELSGREPVMIGGSLDTLYTRYSYSPKIDDAAEYLYERMQAYGIDVDYHYYTLSTYNFFGTHFVDSDYGWVVGSDQRIFKTTDGGQSYVRQKPGALFQDFSGVCFVDTLLGWVSSTNGRVYHTSNGGSSWSLQSTPAGADLREICFLDSVEGWVVGYSGVILHTTDGGANWSSVASGVTSDLYGLHFEAPDRGWACGRYGVVLFWDGLSWTPQTSGSSEYLLDIHFGDSNTGYIVGGGSTVLKTVDGGANWTPLSVPAGTNPYFKGACFVDSLEGWVVGLGGTIIHTDDGGASWTSQPTYTLFGLRWVRFVNNQDGWAVGYGGTIMHTSDGGQVWVGQRGNLPSGALISWKNVVGTKQGTASNEEVIICGHFDSISNDPQNLAPGADDNGSGTVTVVEAARVLGPHLFERTIRFLCVSGEEQGLYGSGEYAADAAMAGDDIVGVINFDMTGYENVAPEDIDVIGNAPSEWLVDFTIDCANAYVPTLPTLKIIDASVTASDHASFWNAGFDALLGIEDRNVPYPYYHTVNDTLGNLNLVFMTDVAKMGIAAVAELAVPDSAAAVPGGGRAPGVASVYPNPLRETTKISFALGAGSRVEARIYDVEGRLVRTLFSSTLPAGNHELKWDGRDAGGRPVSAGVYFTKIETGSQKLSSKIMVLR